MPLIKIVLLMSTGLILINGCALANIGSTRDNESSSKITKKGLTEKDGGEVWTHFAQ
ncbi:MAG TPA: hypothetical protein PLM93_04860 [Sulfuricurvum sp.]|nr:hypothetical protein [Campylobacterota bacterium]HQS66503.1 hypothetical protein [Sulfuricurvum sp.]HQT36502.1 hypothetical protein [Sulfuricurvum sp.]